MSWKWDASKCVPTGAQTEKMHEKCRWCGNVIQDARWRCASKCVPTGTRTEVMLIWKWSASKYVHTGTQTEAIQIWKWSASNYVHSGTQTEKMQMRCFEMRARGHANRGNAYVMQMTWKCDTGCKMKMKCLEMRAHGHANRGNTDSNVNGMEMTSGLIPTWESLSRTHKGCRWKSIERLEMIEK